MHNDLTRRILLSAAISLLLPLCGSHGAEQAIDEFGYLDNHQFEAAFREDLTELFEDDRIPVEISTLRDKVSEEQRFEFTPLQSPMALLTDTEIYQQCRESVVQVGKLYKCKDCDKWHTSTAAGFVIGSDGIIVTSAHVLTFDEEGAAIAVRTYSGQMFTVTDVLASDEHSDLVVLKVDATGLPPLPIAKNAKIGEDIVVIGHPDDRFYVMTEGIVAAKNAHSHHGRAQRSLVITADYARGSSGGPVLNMHGAVVGIVRTTTPVYYETDNGHHKDLQMVWKQCAPSVDLLELFRDPLPPPQRGDGNYSRTDISRTD